MALLDVKNLSISFGGLRAVDGFEMQIEKGELYGLIGPNGAGKTTVFNLLTGVYKPNEGIIKLDGEDITGKKTIDINKAGIARTFQNIRLFKQLSVLDNVKVGLHNHYKYSTLEGILRLPKYKKVEKAMDEKAMEILKVFGLFQHFQIYQLIIKVKLIGDVAITIALIKDVLLPFGFKRRFENHFIYPVTQPDDLDPLTRIPFQDRIFAHCRVYGNLKGTVTNVQDFFQRFFNLLTEAVLLLYFLPYLFLRSTVKYKIIHIDQGNGCQGLNDQRGKACMDLSHLHSRTAFTAPELVFVCIFRQISIQLFQLVTVTPVPDPVSDGICFKVQRFSDLYIIWAGRIDLQPALHPTPNVITHLVQPPHFSLSSSNPISFLYGIHEY